MTDLRVYFAYPGDLDTPSGGYHYDRRLIAELRAMGVEIETVSLPHCSLAMDRQTKTRVVSALAALPDQSIVIIDGLAYGALENEAAAEANRLCLVALCHHPLALETGLTDRQKLALMESERRALLCARATLVTSEHTRQVLVNQFGLPAEKIVVARPGTDKVPFSPCEGNPPRLLTLASLTRRKAHDLLIAALAQLQDTAWQARFVGSAEFDPDWANQLCEQVQSLDLSQRIEFVGTVTDTQREYQQADVFVLPSRFEGYGMVFAEALAAGLPVIAANAGAVPEVVPESAGLLVPPDDATALANALRRMLTSSPLRQRLQSGARSAAQSLPSWEDSATIVANTLHELLP